MNKIIWYTVYDRMMVKRLCYAVGNMIEINIWKSWILKHVVIEFGWIKMDISGDISMSSRVNVSKFFHWKFYLQSETFYMIRKNRLQIYLQWIKCFPWYFTCVLLVFYMIQTMVRRDDWNWWNFTTFEISK